MSEQYPLLCEDSDEDKFAPRFQRRRFAALPGRARLHVKGAAAIMKHWPDYWSSVLTYWWIGFGMIAITTFVIYNTLYHIGMVETVNPRSNKYPLYKSVAYKTGPKTISNVFMHVFVNDEGDDFQRYMSHIELLANKYKDFMYNLVVLVNNTNSETTSNYMQDETNNNIALNTLWSSNINYDNIASVQKNIKVKHYSLSEYLDNSPINKYWRDLPSNLLPFLVRAISVWEKGGIAINPILLTPKSPNAAYMEKIVTILKNFKITETSPSPNHPNEIVTSKRTIFPKVNNIRDIIDDLELKESDEPLEEVLNAEESVLNTELIKFKGYDTTSKIREKSSIKSILTKYSSTEKPIEEQKSSIISEHKDKGHTKLLPLFLEYLFHNKNVSNRNHSIEKREMSTQSNFETNLNIRSVMDDVKSSQYYKPMIISAQDMNERQSSDGQVIDKNSGKVFELTVDLKGNLIATGTPCHAFIGNIFLDVANFPYKGTLTDFIIKELSVFCKGLLTSCMGIDVILV